MQTSRSFRIAFTITIVCLAILSSCSYAPPPKDAWVQVSDVAFNNVLYDKSSNTIWLQEFSEGPESAVYKVEQLTVDHAFVISPKIATPNGSIINSICVSNGVWISSYAFPRFFTPTVGHIEPSSSALYTIYKYIEASKSWQEISTIADPAKCKVLKNGNIAFTSRDKIILIDTTTAQAQYLTADSELVDIASDLKGDLWISTINGEIYRQIQGGWELIDDLGANSKPQLFIDNNGNLWVSSNNRYIYKYLNSHSKLIMEEQFESSFGIGQEFFEDRNGMIWITTIEELMIQKQVGFQEVTLPPHSKFIRYGFYNSNENTLFISTSRGVFFLDLAKLNK